MPLKIYKICSSKTKGISNHFRYSRYWRPLLANCLPSPKCGDMATLAMSMCILNNPTYAVGNTNHYSLVETQPVKCQPPSIHLYAHVCTPFARICAPVPTSPTPSRTKLSTILTGGWGLTRTVPEHSTCINRYCVLPISQAIRLAQFMSQVMNYKFCYRSCNPHQTCQKMKIYKAVPLERFEQLLLLDNSPWRGFILEVRGTLYDLDYSILWLFIIAQLRPLVLRLLITFSPRLDLHVQVYVDSHSLLTIFQNLSALNPPLRGAPPLTHI